MAESVQVAIPEILSAALRALERANAGRRLRVIRQIDPTTPEVAVDPETLRQVVDTLLAEAAAATEEGGRVRVCLKHSRGTVMISVKDQGEGMREGEFEAKLEDPAREAVAGAPLTLAGCRKAVVSMRGNLFANAEPRRGSTYYVVLPVPV